MYPRTTAFDAAIVKSHTIATKVEVYSSGRLISDISLKVIDGNITIDDVDIHRRATLTLTDPTGTLVPANVTDLLTPLGNEIKLYRGIKYSDTSSELLPQGVFGIDDVRITDSGDGLNIQIDTYDRAKRVQRARFVNDYSVVAGTNYVTAIYNILISRYPTIQTNFPTIGATTPALFFSAGDDPWKACQDMAASLGYDLYFDVNGICIMVPVTLSGPTQWTYAEGAQAMLLYTNRRINREGIYNHVVYTGETSGVSVPVRAESLDNNPLSPTYYLGNFGDVVTFEASSFVTTVGQAQAAADRRLAKVLGLVEQIEFQSVPHPAHEIGDIIQVTRAASKINSVYALTKITMPMVHDRPIAASCRQRFIPL